MYRVMTLEKLLPLEEFLKNRFQRLFFMIFMFFGIQKSETTLTLRRASQKE
jgi:hypothetical protein